MQSDSALIEHTELNALVYERLHSRIVSGRLDPGTKLSLHTLADELGVSRSPVHHAVTRLVTEGLLTVKPRRGYYVTPLTIESLHGEYDVRLALELLAAERAIDRISDEQRRELHESMEKARPQAHGEDFAEPAEFVRANNRFHQLQVDLAGNAKLSGIYRGLGVNLLMERILRGLTGQRETIASINADHERIHAAFADRDLASAQAAIRDHVETGKHIVVQAIDAAGGWI